HEGADVVVVVVLGVVPALERHTPPRGYPARGSGCLDRVPQQAPLLRRGECSTCRAAEENARVLEPRASPRPGPDGRRRRFGGGVGEGADRRLEEAAEAIACLGGLVLAQTQAEAPVEEPHQWRCGPGAHGAVGEGGRDAAA